ncbi:MAG: hypothetical protein MZU84_03925 [Sphingobacterium sp.]|nr:hypothetical protein [Sphingobacterium sp.]
MHRRAPAAARRPHEASDVFMQSTAHFTPFGHEAIARVDPALPRGTERASGAWALMVFNSAAVRRLLPGGARPLPPSCRTGARNWLLLAASYYFYASWDWRFPGLLVALHWRWRTSAGRCSAASRTAGRGRWSCSRASARTSRCWGSSATSTSSRENLQALRRPRRVAAGRLHAERCCCRSASRSTRSSRWAT